MIQINVTGATGTGKTAILGLIEDTLRNAGFAVSLDDSVTLDGDHKLNQHRRLDAIRKSAVVLSLKQTRRGQIKVQGGYQPDANGITPPPPFGGSGADTSLRR